jgi:hypothetical protein
MSSMLQFKGETSYKKGVRLEFVLRRPDAAWNDPPEEPVLCGICGKEHERIHVAWRKPAGMWGPWVVFRYNGEEHVPDLSIPISVDKIPRGAVPLEDAQNDSSWHRT